MRALNELVDIGALRTVLAHEAETLAADTHEAEDLVEECLEVLLNHWKTIRNHECILPWCRIVIRNLFRQRLRRHWYAEVLGVEHLPEDSWDPWRAVDTRLVVENALQQLPLRQRAAASSFYLCGASIAEIARSQGRPEGTIKRWLHEGREALKLLLEEGAADRPKARIYGSNWLEDARKSLVSAVSQSGYSPVLSDLAEDGSLPTDAALLIFGERVGSRTGLELLLAVRGTEATATTPVLLFGPARQTAVLAAWQAGADAYMTDPSSPDVIQLLAKLCNAAQPDRHCDDRDR